MEETGINTYLLGPAGSRDTREGGGSGGAQLSMQNTTQFLDSTRPAWGAVARPTLSPVFYKLCVTSRDMASPCIAGMGSSSPWHSLPTEQVPAGPSPPLTYSPPPFGHQAMKSLTVWLSSGQSRVSPQRRCQTV